MFVQIFLQALAFGEVLLFVELEKSDDFHIEVLVDVKMDLLGNRKSRLVMSLSKRYQLLA